MVLTDPYPIADGSGGLWVTPDDSGQLWGMTEKDLAHPAKPSAALPAGTDQGRLGCNEANVCSVRARKHFCLGIH